MFDVASYLNALGVLLLKGALTWLISLYKRDVSIVDSLWSLMFLAAALVYWLGVDDPAGRASLVMGLVALWSLRLAGYITWRNRGEGEDYRYREIRARNEPGFAFKSLYLVFGLQAVIAWLVSLPLLAAISADVPLGFVDGFALGQFVIGFVFEAVGDLQLARFKADPGNAGKVLDTGLWRYTRHPNYFGNACMWWAFFIFALATGAWWSVLSPLLMTFLLLKVSGVALLEQDIGDRRPAYRDYVRRTNAFFPGPPRSDSYSRDRQEVSS